MCIRDRLSLGATYRKAPRFDYKAINVLYNDVDGNPLPQPELFSSFNKVRFDVPDIFGVGLSWRPIDTFVVNFDLDRVMYSQPVSYTHLDVYKRQVLNSAITATTPRTIASQVDMTCFPLFSRNRRRV